MSCTDALWHLGSMEDHGWLCTPQAFLDEWVDGQEKGGGVAGVRCLDCLLEMMKTSTLSTKELDLKVYRTTWGAGCPICSRHACVPRELTRDQAVCQAIRANTELEALTLQCGTLTFTGLGEALKGNTTLQNLRLAACPVNGLKYEALAAVEGALCGDEGRAPSNTTLRALDLSENHIQHWDFSALIERNSTLLSLDIHQNWVGYTPYCEKMLRGLATGNATLRSLNLSRTCISPANLDVLGSALLTNHSLTHLDASMNSFDVPSCLGICEALADNHALTHLDIGRNRLSHAAFVALGGALPHNTSLRTLGLAVTQMRQDDCLRVCAGLRANRALTSLDLSRNGVEGVGGVLLANTTLQELTMQCLGAGPCCPLDDTMREICAGLRGNRGLLSLDLSLSSLTETCFALLSDALQGAYSLERLNLADTELGAAGCVHLAHALSRNPRMRHLDLSFNDIDERGCALLCEGLKANSTLSSLALHQNNVGAGGCSALGGLLAANRILSRLSIGPVQCLGGCEKSVLPLGLALRDTPRCRPFELVIDQGNGGGGDENLPGAISLGSVYSELGLPAWRCPAAARGGGGFACRGRAFRCEGCVRSLGGVFPGCQLWGGWTSARVAAHFRRMHVEIVHAFRLGGRRRGCVVSLLSTESVDLVVRAYFGMPLCIQ